jgi:hypothetical protein
MINKGPGQPGTFPLPNSGQQGNAFVAQQNMHPSAMAAQQQRARLAGGRNLGPGGKK